MAYFGLQAASLNGLDAGRHWTEHGWLVLTATGNARRQAAMVASLIALGRQYEQRALFSYGQAPAGIARADVVKLLWL